MTTNFEKKAALSALEEAPGGVLCAVSGGADSMALLHLLWRRRFPVVAAHYEHGLRGEESLRDADFVAGWCAERSIPCVMEHGDVAAYARLHGLGAEEAARQLRYDFLTRAAAAHRCAWIATAHTADDNAETVLLNLCRGTGAAGLRGIPPRRENILRPLLGCTRSEVEEYLAAYGVAHVEDSSNEGDDYRRNLLRHQVLPVLRSCNPAFPDAVLRMGKLLRQDEDCLSAQAEAFIRTWYDGESLPAAELNRLHPAIASRVLRRLWSGLEQGHVEQILAACAQGKDLRLSLPGQGLRLWHGRLAADQTEEAPPLPDRALAPGETVDIPEAGLRIRAELASMDEEIYDLFKTLNFKYANICGKLYCTGRKAGDTLHPVGRGCGKGLKALFQEAGLDRWERQRVPLFRDEKGLLAIYGLALDARAAAKPGDRVLRLHLERLDAEGEKNESGH